MHKEHAGAPHALSMKTLKLEQCLGEDQLVTCQAGGNKSYQFLRNNEKFLGTKVKRFVDVSRSTNYDYVIEWMHELLSDAWNNGKSLSLYFY